MKSIKIMPDYECHPLWHNNSHTVGNIDPKMLPISEHLAKQFYKWAEAFDATLNQENPRESGFNNLKAKTKFVAKGYELALLLKGELRDVEVMYFDIDQNQQHTL